MNRPTIPEVVGRFAAYYDQPGNMAWGSLHIVLDDHNVGDSSVQFCMEWAAERGDVEGYQLASILLLMSKSQRGRLARKVDDYLAHR